LRRTAFGAVQVFVVLFVDGLQEVSARITSMEKDLDEFMLKFESGELDGSPDYFDWFAAKRAIDSQQANQ
jgi:hypothetical protein